MRQEAHAAEFRYRRADVLVKKGGQRARALFQGGRARAAGHRIGRAIDVNAGTEPGEPLLQRARHAVRGRAEVLVAEDEGAAPAV